MKIITLKPKKTGNQTDLQAWIDPKDYIEEKITVLDPLVFIEPKIFCGIAVNCAYFLRDNATYWYYVKGPIIIKQ